MFCSTCVSSFESGDEYRGGRQVRQNSAEAAGKGQIMRHSLNLEIDENILKMENINENVLATFHVLNYVAATQRLFTG